MFFSIKVRDEYRQDYDAGRGGYGKLAQNQWVVESPILKACSFGLLNLTGVTQEAGQSADGLYNFQKGV